MNDKTIVAFCVTAIACIALFIFKDQAMTIASSTITGLLGMASGQAWK
jgi:hypothetical protein